MSPRAHLTHQDWLRHFYVFDFNESPAGESFSLPAASIKMKDCKATSVSRPVFISTPSSAENNMYLDESAQPRLFGERECCCVRDNEQNAGHNLEK